MPPRWGCPSALDVCGGRPWRGVRLSALDSLFFMGLSFESRVYPSLFGLTSSLKFT
ncbi:hypothetical protein MCP1_50033 [Candidatus Terasakiella magnetica]|nr:hypothetical protein MCP1_50033 [Candidatus Terasakiella magnetica]